MNFPTFLKNLKERNPKLFRADEIKIKISSLTSLLESTYRAGYNEANDFHVNLNKMKGKKENLGDFFGGVFGGK